MKRVPAGLPDLDRLIEGGIPRPFCLSVSGVMGSGKHLLVWQMIDSFLKNGCCGLYICLDYPAIEIRHLLNSLGVEIESYEKKGNMFFLDIFSERAHKIMEGEVFDIDKMLYSPDEIMRKMMPYITKLGERGFVVIDTVSTLLMSMNAKEAYTLIHGINILTKVQNLIGIGISHTGAITTRELEMMRSNADGCIRLEKGVLWIERFDRTAFSDERLAVSITERGTIVLKSILPKEVNKEAARHILGLFSTSPTIELDVLMSLKSKPESRLPTPELVSTLKKLEETDLLEAKPLRSVVACPFCDSLTTIFYIRCPDCRSSQMVKGDALEHLSCGYIDFRSKFDEGGKLVCPKCGKEVRQLGVDYRKAGSWYRCSNLHLFASPILSFRCLRCDKEFDLDEARLQMLHQYQLTEKGQRQL